MNAQTSGEREDHDGDRPTAHCSYSCNRRTLAGMAVSGFLNGNGRADSEQNLLKIHSTDTTGWRFHGVRERMCWAGLGAKCTSHLQRLVLALAFAWRRKSIRYTQWRPS